MNINPKVQRFAADMTRELKANEHKGNWEEWGTVEEMICELEYHKAKLLIALREGDKSRVREHLADCGNILMFIGNAGGLYEADSSTPPQLHLPDVSRAEGDPFYCSGAEEHSRCEAQCDYCRLIENE